MAAETGLSQNAIVRIWRASDCGRIVEDFKFSKDRQFVEKVRDIVGYDSSAKPEITLGYFA